MKKRSILMCTFTTAVVLWLPSVASAGFLISD